MQQQKKNLRFMAFLGILVVGMVGLAYASVPLYKLFCQVTGYGGTPTISDVAADEVLERKITVRFTGMVSGGLDWKFIPKQLKQTSYVGSSQLASFTATNRSDRPITGTATYNVSPAKAAEYFVKLDCFCFTEQVLQPGETAQMPVLYYIDPEIDNDRRLDEIKTITLSYTFFELKNSKSAKLAEEKTDNSLP
ncbi:Cytochrome oxidase biogenesis protein Cox11-CtaG, copper delivery to Cox1 [hydrothermal vent metagenome]|uniref:Cytochrome oxidase biogenesis protein Cox11-CtaG, copper delivery to Cox1 n=1 Tax=hydrothermal vent metagenome TaxID=652676 RepID=A0A3B0SFE6_9ZZZZ